MKVYETCPRFLSKISLNFLGLKKNIRGKSHEDEKWSVDVVPTRKSSGREDFVFVFVSVLVSVFVFVFVILVKFCDVDIWDCFGG